MRPDLRSRPRALAPSRLLTVALIAVLAAACTSSGSPGPAPSAAGTGATRASMGVTTLPVETADLAPSPSTGSGTVAANGAAAGAEPSVQPPAPAAPVDLASVSVRLSRVASGLKSPVYVTQPDDGRNRLFVVEQGGRIRIVDPKVGLIHAPFLDVGSLITTGGERGLLGLAFHPAYRTNGRFFVYYTDTSGRLTVAEYRRKDATHADPTSARILLRIAHPQGNHNGGMMAFGPDGMLYIGTGDGGGAGDPQRNGQNGAVLLGKLLRIDVNGKKPYAIPSTNPFVHRTGFRPEIWAYGLRNPWRFSFDRATGALYIGDVGQGAWEEIDVAAKGKGGQDYGWSIREGNHCFNPSSGCRSKGLTPPVLEYSHSQGCAVIGGFVDRLSASALNGTYLFSDYCSGRLWGFSAAAALKGTVRATLLDDTSLQVTGFGQDLRGQVYLVDAAGGLYRVVGSRG